MDTEQLKKNIEATFNDVSGRYDQNRFFAISAARMAELIPFMEEMNVLDVSTGTGAVAIEVARKYRHAKVEGIDLSPGMLKQAKIKARAEALDNIEFAQCDVEAMPYDEGMFDVATCGYALFFYPDMEASYRAICRTLKPGGMFVFSSFTSEAFNPYADIFLRRLERDYKIEAPSRLRERLKTEAQIEALAMSCGHARVEVERYPIRYAITVDNWWSLLNNAGYKSLLDQLNHEQLLQFKRKHLGEIEAASDDETIELNADTLFGLVNVE